MIEADALEASTGLEVSVERHLSVVPGDQKPSETAEIAPPSLVDLKIVLLEKGTEAYREAVDQLTLDPATQRTVVAEIEKAFSEGLPDSPEVTARVTELQQKLLAGNLVKLLDLAQEIKRTGHKVHLGLLIIQANKLASLWIKREYGTLARAKKAPIIPTNVMCDDYVGPKLREYSPSPQTSSRPRLKPRPVRPVKPDASLEPAIGHNRTGQGYLLGLASPYRSPPSEKARTKGEQVLEKLVSVKGQGRLDLPKPAKEPWRIGENKRTGQLYLLDLLMPNPRKRVKESFSSKAETEDDKPPVVKRLLGQLTLREQPDTQPQTPKVRSARTEKSPSLRVPSRSSPREAVEVPDAAPTAPKRSPRSRQRTGGTIPLGDTFSVYSVESLDQPQTRVISEIVKHILEDGPIDWIEIQRLEWRELSAALHFCLHTDEYLTNKDPLVSGRFDRISSIANASFASRRRKSDD